MSYDVRTIYETICADNLEAFKKLIEKNPNILEKYDEPRFLNYNEENIIHMVVNNSRYEMLKYLLEKKKFNLELESIFGTPLYHATKFLIKNNPEHYRIVHLLLEYGANPNIAGKYSKTDSILDTACMTNNDILAHLLISNGADITSKFYRYFDEETQKIILDSVAKHSVPDVKGAL